VVKDSISFQLFISIIVKCPDLFRYDRCGNAREAAQVSGASLHRPGTGKQFSVPMCQLWPSDIILFKVFFPYMGVIFIFDANW